MFPRFIVIVAAALLIMPITGVTTIVALVDGADSGQPEPELQLFSGAPDELRRHHRIVSPADLMLDEGREIYRDMGEDQEAVLPAAANPSTKTSRPGGISTTNPISR